MKWLPLLLLSLVLSACTSAKAAKCNALRAHFEETVDDFNRCLDKLGVHADASVCQPHADAPGRATSPALAACGEAAAEVAAKAAKAAAKAEKEEAAEEAKAAKE